MDDIISREMAIDAVVDRLKKMPSVQSKTSPKISEILDYLDTILHPIVAPECYAVYSTLYDMISLLDLEQEAVISVPSTQQWIPISEAKPEPFQKVLVTMRINGWNGEKDDIVESRAYDGDYRITAWMPLPEPYNSNLK